VICRRSGRSSTHYVYKDDDDDSDDDDDCDVARAVVSAPRLRGGGGKL